MMPSGSLKLETSYLAADGAVTWKATNFCHEVVESSFAAHGTEDRRAKPNHQRTVADGGDSFLLGKLMSLDRLGEGICCNAILSDILGEELVLSR